MWVTHFDAIIVGGSPEFLRTEMAVLPHASRPHLLDWDSAEQMRRREVSRILEKMDLSPKEEEYVERLSYLIVAKILTGPISDAMARMIHTVSTGRGVNHVLATSGAHVKDRSLEVPGFSRRSISRRVS